MRFFFFINLRLNCSFYQGRNNLERWRERGGRGMRVICYSKGLCKRVVHNKPGLDIRTIPRLCETWDGRVSTKIQNNKPIPAHISVCTLFMASITCQHYWFAVPLATEWAWIECLSLINSDPHRGFTCCGIRSSTWYQHMLSMSELPSFLRFTV